MRVLTPLKGVHARATWFYVCLRACFPAKDILDFLTAWFHTWLVPTCLPMHFRCSECSGCSLQEGCDRLVSLCLPSTRSSSAGSIIVCNLASLRPVLPWFLRRITWYGSVPPWFGCLSPFASLVMCWCRDPVPWWLANLFSFVFRYFLVQESSSVMIWRFVSLCLHFNFLVHGFSFPRFVSICLSSSPVSSPFYFLELERQAVWGGCWCNNCFSI